MGLLKAALHRLEQRLNLDLACALRRTAMVFALALLTTVLFGERETSIELDIQGSSKVARLFYASANEGFSDQRRVDFTLSADRDFHEHRVTILSRARLSRLKVDTNGEARDLTIRRVSVEAGLDRAVLDANAIRKLLRAGQNVKPVVASPGVLHLLALGDDPRQEIKLPGGSKLLAALTVVGSIWIAFAYASIWLAADVLFALAVRKTRQLGRLRSSAHSLAAILSDDGVLRVGPRLPIGLAIIAAAACVYVVLHLHQSSIGMWEHYFPERPVEQLVEVGEARGIRSDEWHAVTPWTLSQVHAAGATTNENVGGERAPFIASVPIVHPSALLFVRHYGFALFGLEAGFSWLWAYRLFGVTLSFFWLLAIVTNGDLKTSALGSFWIYASSYTQWWYSSPLTDLMVVYALASVGFTYLMFAEKRYWIAAGGGMLMFSAANMPQHLYPPFIVPLVYLSVFIFGAMLCRPGALGRLRSDIRWRAAVLVVCLGVAGVMLAFFFVDGRSTIDVMMHTVYPGRRVSTSGGSTLNQLFYGLFEGFRFGEGRLPARTPNASEASAFFVVAPLALPAFLLSTANGWRSAKIWSLVGYLLLVAAWTCLELPAPINTLLQRAGWSYTPPMRAVVGLGVGSIFLTVLLLARARAAQLARPTSGPRTALLMAAAFLLVAGYGLYLRRSDLPFYTWQTVAAGAIAATLIVGSVATGSLTLAIIGVGLIATPPLTVNPVTSGLSALMEKPILLAAREASRRATDKWAVIGSVVLSQGLKAHGLNVATGVHMVPNLDFTAQLDPTGAQSDVWNRYAHISFASAPNSSSPVFKLFGNDSYDVALDVCGEHFRRLRVTHVAYTVAVPPDDLRCLRSIQAPSDSGVKLFEYRP